MPKIKKNIGLLGGTFDPIHNAHLQIAEHVMNQFNLDEVWFIPTGTPPHRNPPHFCAKDRLKMCELALKNKPQFKLCTIEAKKTTPCYTIETIQALKKQYPNNHFYLILGMDAFSKIERWHESEALLHTVDILVINRPEFDAPKGLNNARTTFISIPPCEISATKIRSNLTFHQKDLPKAVLNYIVQHNLL